MDLLNLVQVLGNVQPVNDQVCHGLLFLVRIIRKGVFPILQIGVPIILIVLGTLDLAKAVIASEEKQVKEAQSKLIKRCIYAAAVFFVTTLVTLLMNIVAKGADKSENNTTSWATCWRSVK